MTSLPRLTDRLTLGSGLLVSPICLGMVPSPRVVLEAFEAGINFFFVTADMHWPLYEPLRRGLSQLFKKKGTRDEVVVCATAYVTQPDFCEMPFEELVESIPGLGRLDVVTMGGVYGSDFGPRLPVYRRHREAGFLGAKAIGASFHERTTARLALEHELVDLAFIRFNPGHPGAAHDVLPFLPERRRARVFNFKSMDGFIEAEGVRPTDHYRFALSQDGMDGVLAALSSAKEIRELSDALRSGPLTREQQAALVDLASAARGAA
jgi:hypothetical protein